MKKNLVLAMFVLAACGDNKSKLDPTSGPNQAVEVVKFATGDTAKCDPVFHNENVHSARCSLPDGSKIYCTASVGGWGCSALSQPPGQQAQAPQPQPPQGPMAVPPPPPPPPPPAPLPPAPPMKPVRK